jgi:hypothetical protein
MALRRKHIDLLHQTITIDEQVQYIGGRHLGLPPKSAAGRRSVAVPAVVASELEKHLGLYAEPGAEGLLRGPGRRLPPLGELWQAGAAIGRGRSRSLLQFGYMTYVTLAPRSPSPRGGRQGPAADVGARVSGPDPRSVRAPPSGPGREVSPAGSTRWPARHARPEDAGNPDRGRYQETRPRAGELKK